MSEQSGQERTEEATPKRRQEFRERGEVAKSQELASAIMLCAGLGALLLVLVQADKHLGPLFRDTLSRLDEAENWLSGPRGYFGTQLTEVMLTLGPAFLLLSVTALLAHFLQTGPLLSLKALTPRPDKLNPLPGLKRIFLSKDAVANLIKTMAKVILIGAVAALAVLSMRAELVALVGKSPADLGRYLVKVAGYPLVACALVMLVIGVVHLAWQRRRMNERMKMTQEEAKRERKDSEGDPLQRRRARNRHRDLLTTNRLIDTVPDAHVIITNPTHFSVALSYRPAEGAPVVVAKGVDYRALRIRQIADDHDVPIVENPPLARALHYQVDVGRQIPEAFFRAVSEVLAYVMRQQGQQQWRSDRP